MTPEQIVAMLGATGAGAVLLALVNGIVKWLSGASAREQQKNTDLLSQRTNAIADRIKTEKERDDADDKRREAEEHVSILKRQLREHGLVPLERSKTLQE